jgi:hypothetical protein
VIFLFGIFLFPFSCGVIWFPILVRCLCWFPVLVRCLFYSDLRQSKSSANSMTLTLSTLQIRKHDYSGHWNFLKSTVGIVTFVDIKQFYASNSDVVSLFANSSFLVFSEFEYIKVSIDVLYLFEWMNIVIFSKKIISAYYMHFFKNCILKQTITLWFSNNFTIPPSN